MKKLNVLHVVRQFYPAIGGLEVYVKNMVQHQQKLGHICEVLTLNKIFNDKNIVLSDNEVIDEIIIKRISFVGGQRVFMPIICPKYFKQFDVIHVHNTDVFFDYLAFSKIFHRKPLVATTHGGYFHTKNLAQFKKIYFNTITKLSAKFYNSIIAISQNDLDIFKIINKNILLCPNAVEPMGEKIVKGQDFIYIGRLAEHKNIPGLIEVFALLKDYKVPGSLHIVGPEWDVKRDDLKSMAELFNIKKYVKVHGFLSNEELAKTIDKCGFFVSASMYEGFGMSMIEGMSVGLIPIVQPNNSFRELVRQAKLGICVDYTNPTIAAQNIQKYIKTVKPEDKAKAREFSKLFSWDKLTENTVKEYYKVLGP